MSLVGLRHEVDMREGDAPKLNSVKGHRAITGMKMNCVHL